MRYVSLMYWLVAPFVTDLDAVFRILKTEYDFLAVGATLEIFQGCFDICNGEHLER